MAFELLAQSPTIISVPMKDIVFVHLCGSAVSELLHSS